MENLQYNKKKHTNRFHYSQDQAMEKPFDWAQIRRLLGFMKPYSRTLLPGSIVTMLLSTLIRLLIPILIGKVAIDMAISSGDTRFLIYLVAVIGVLYVLNYVANILRIKWVNILGQHVIYDLRKTLFSHIQHLSHRFFDTRSAGSILVRVLNDINSLQELFTNGIINLLTDSVMLIGIIAILFFLSPKLALAVLIILPLMFFISTRLRRSIRRSWQQVRMQKSRMNSHLNEAIQGIRVTQSYAQEPENTDYFEALNRDNFESERIATKKSAYFGPFVELSNAIGTVILIAYGAHLILSDQIEIGTFVTFAFFLGMFWEPISRLGQIYNQLLVAMASSERIFEFLDEEPNVENRKDAKPLPNIKGDIRFEKVVFAYNSDRIALQEIDLHMEAGQTVALVGHTGSGKSTIANLISRFYDPTAGAVKIDGEDLRDVRLQDVRQQISVVLQDTFVFSGTIMENIRFGNPKATDEQVKEAARIVGADDFIQRLADGYETEVEERGNILSAGERQLLSFARTMLADPRIIILDEATASIDTETELKIQHALKTLLQGRTAIMIAHRLSTIREADNIIVLEHGRILEQGNHMTLMNERGKYYELVKTQFQSDEK